MNVRLVEDGLPSPPKTYAKTHFKTPLFNKMKIVIFRIILPSEVRRVNSWCAPKEKHRIMWLMLVPASPGLHRQGEIAMKLVLAVVQDIDADAAMKALTDAQFRVTRVASTGGFFRQGNSTIFCATQDDEVEQVLRILRTTCQRRTRLHPVHLDPTEPIAMGIAYTEIPIGGATVFVIDVARFEQI